MRTWCRRRTRPAFANRGRPTPPSRSPLRATRWWWRVHGTLPAEERLEPRRQRGADQRAVDPTAEPVPFGAVRVEPERREIESLEVHVAHLAQVAKPVLAVHAAEPARLHSAPGRLRRRVRVERVVVHH